MTRRFIFGAILAVAVAVGLLCWRRYSHVQPADHRPDRSGWQTPRSSGSTPPVTVKQINKTAQSQGETAKELQRRDTADPKWEWRMPISFFGRVVDENLAPVPGATVEFQWTDLSDRGTSTLQTTSDGTGLFSLRGTQGKRLLVRVSKDGYYASAEKNQLSFEYANPYEQNYYIPSADHPILFHLRKKGAENDLISYSIKLMLQGGGATAGVDLMGGKVSASGDLQVTSWKPWPPQPMTPHYDWKVVLRITGGGFVDAPTEFAFEAPETVYDAPFELDMRADGGDGWQVSAEKTLYFAFGEPKRYGRLHFRTDANSRYVFIDYVINPSGSRNLE